MDIYYFGPSWGKASITDDAPNFIYANHGGADTISSAGGNDEIHVDDGLGDDVVDCGETLYSSSDYDTVHFDSGDQIADNCESKRPAN